MFAKPLRHCLMFLLLATSLRIASGQSGETAPQGDVTLAAPAQICGMSLLRRPYFDIAKTGTLRYRLTPTEAGHIGRAVDVFAGFRLQSQPDKLWLLSGPAPTRLVEYRDGDMPTPLGEQAVLERIAYFTVFEPPAGGFVDLTAFKKDGELLFGYGLRDGPEATAADAFREMIGSRRFHVIWWIGAEPTAEACYNYSRVTQRPRSGQGEPLN